LVGPGGDLKGGLELQRHGDLDRTDAGAPDLEPVPMDPDAMHACLTNLVGNAIDACTWDPDTDKAHRIELRALSRPEGGVVFEVSDNGMGISEENQPKILAVHFTTKGIRGTGLGLLLTRKVVEEHGGTIAFASTPGEGTVFKIQLPFITSQPDVMPAKGAEKKAIKEKG